jgi:hypothetical protein
MTIAHRSFTEKPPSQDATGNSKISSNFKKKTPAPDEGAGEKN